MNDEPAITHFCTECGKRIDSPDQQALGVEVSHGLMDDGDPEFEEDAWERRITLRFCSESHLREWFQTNPLPSADQWHSLDDHDNSVAGYVACVVAALVVLSVFGFAAYGFFNAVRSIL